MDLVFDRGEPQRAKGHALLYFKSPSDQVGLWVTYVVILPLSVDVSKYLPPFIMNQVGEIGPRDLSAFAFPPAPERLDSREALEALAIAREDDILFGGTINPDDVSSAMLSINEAVQQYASLYSEIAAEEPSLATPEEGTGLGVNEVLYGLMSESDKLGELTKLVGRLRFALEGSDEGLIKEAEAEIEVLGNHLPEINNIPELVAAVKSSERHGSELAELYLQRCFHLVQEEYSKLGHIEAKIRELEAQGSSS